LGTGLATTTIALIVFTLDRGLPPGFYDEAHSQLHTNVLSKIDHTKTIPKEGFGAAHQSS
jgi:hypothetical protein